MGGGQFKAFTLIELLAIIVILAIIAVITIPIILNVIDNANKGSAIDSAYGYKDAVYKSFLEELSEDSSYVLPTGIFILSDNNKLEGDGDITVNVSGTVPESGSWIELREGEVIAYSLKIGDYIVTKYENEEVTATKGTEVALNQAQIDLNTAKEQALTLVNSIKNGSSITTGIIESDGNWVAVIDNNIIGYSVKVNNINGNNYVVTKHNSDTDAHGAKNGIVASYEEEEILIVKALVSNYINALSSDSTVLAYTEDKVLNVTEITSVTKPESTDNNSWVRFTYNSEATPKVSITDYSIKNNDYVVDYSSSETDNMQATKNGTLRNKPILLVKKTKADGKKYYNTFWVNAYPVYFDPTADSGTCTEQDYNNNPNKLGKTGCMKWYAYSENADGTVNMILNHNTTQAVAWVSEEDYYQNNEKDESNNYIGTTPPTIPPLATTLGITYPSNRVQGTDEYGNNGNWNKGPITLLNQLMEDTNPSGEENATNRWKNGLIQRSSYDSYTNSNTMYKTESETVHDNYTINYSGYNARLITVQEVYYITGVVFDFDEDLPNSLYFYLANNAWLVENLKTTSNTSLPDEGYWTVSSVNGYSHSAWYLKGKGYLKYCGYVDYSSVKKATNYGGVRPVITVSNSVVFGS